MKHKPKPAHLVTKSEYARMRGLDPALVSRRLADGLLTAEGPDELLDVAKADAALKDALGAAGRKPARRGSTAPRRGSTAPRPGSGRRAATRLKGLSLHEARTLRAREDAERAAIAKQREAIELQKLRGEVATISEVAQALGDNLTILRATLMGMPSRLTPQLAAESSEAKVYAILMAAVVEALTELSEQAAEAAAKAERPGQSKPEKDGAS